MQHQVCGAILSVVQDLADRYEDAAIKDPLWLGVRERFTRMTRPKLDNFIQQRTCRLPAWAFVFLEPNRDMGFVPVMRFRWNFEDGAPDLTLRLFLFGEEGHIGFRFDSAERKGAARPYCHVQLIRGWSASKEEEVAGNGPSFWPERLPAFPIQATNPVTLLLGLLLTLYGAEKVRKDILGNLDGYQLRNVDSATRGSPLYEALRKEE